MDERLSARSLWVVARAPGADLAGESVTSTPFAVLLLAQAAVFAAAVLSGNIPPAVVTLFRALLTF